MKKFFVLTLLLCTLGTQVSFADSPFSEELMNRAILNLNVNIEELTQEEMIEYHIQLNNEYMKLVEERRLEQERLKQAEEEARLAKERQKQEEMLRGRFNNLTEGTLAHRNEVLRLQAEMNLVVDGSFGPKTREAVASGAVAKDYITNPPSKGKWIAIDFDLRILTLYEGNSVVKKYPVTIGKSSAPTPTAQTVLVGKTMNRRWNGAGRFQPIAGGHPNNPLGPRWLELSSRIGSGYGIHGTNNEWSIGGNESLGCIRMLNEDVIELYEKVGGGTPVWMGRSETLRQWGLEKQVR